MTDEKEKKIWKLLLKLTPPQIITISFALMILCGAILLNLPVASRSGESIGFLNALFTATSANCVTGLVVVNTLAQWSLFGQVVLLCLIQFGALGLMTVMTMVMLALRRQISLRDRLVIQASFNQNNIGGMVRFVKHIVRFTLVAEGIGAILLAAIFFSGGGYSLAKALYMGVFHAISAFCNAGFDIIGAESLTPYRDNIFLNIVIMALIVAGGLGFTVWADILGHSSETPAKSKGFSWRRRLSLHSKIALIVTAVLIASGFILFILFEWTNPATLGPLSFREKILGAAFQSVTLRTAGFNTIDQGGLTDISQLFSCLFMFIGGSPAGTAGGIKTVTLGVIIISILSVLRGKSRVEAMGRTLTLDLLQKALTVLGTMVIVILTSTVVLYFTERGSLFQPSLMDLLFETTSAAATVGISTGLTPYLSSAGKAVITLCMYLGRLSPVTVVVALNMKLHANGDRTAFPKEKVIIG